MPGGAEHPVSGSRDLSRAEQLQSGDSFQCWFYRAKPSPHFPKSELLRRGRQGSEALTEAPPPPPLTGSVPSGRPVTWLGPLLQL